MPWHRPRATLGRRLLGRGRRIIFAALSLTVSPVGSESWLRGSTGSERSSLDFPMPPDVRPKACRRDFTGVDMGGNITVSIIIPYLGETWEHFRPTMRSILHNTPDELIEEFILVSDGNPPEKTYEAALTAMSPKVTVVKNHKRMGLIVSKMLAVERAKGAVLMFLEAHCIVNRDWLQPLLVRLVESPRALVQPHLDLIPQDNFNGYEQGVPGHFRFEWNMNLIYTTPPEPAGIEVGEDEPVPSPATSGGIFAIRKDWWNTLGFYDPELREWGGDHVEATMKVWRCGGHIDVHPCSRIGHLFRDPAHRPYDVNIDIVVHNYARLARVWWDDYLPKFYQVKPETQSMALGDLSAQMQQREQLACKDMEWYIHNVDPEMEWEASRICIPGASTRYGGCENPGIPGRSTVDRTMPDAEYRHRRGVILLRLRRQLQEDAIGGHEL